MKKGNVIINNIISIFISLLLVIMGMFVYNMFMGPKKTSLNVVRYTPIDQFDYSVSDNQLDGTLFGKLNFQFNDQDLDKYRDLKDFYQGRDNPFGNSENKDEIIMPQEESNNAKGDGTNDETSGDDIETIID